MTEMTGGAEVPATIDLWQSVAETGRDQPAWVALRDSQPGSELTYGQLCAAVAELAGRLDAAGIGIGDRVAIAARRGARELVAILAVLHRGAAWFSLEPSIPPLLARSMLAEARARLVLGDRGRLAALDPGIAGSRQMVIPGLAERALDEPVPPAAVAGDAPAYLSFRLGRHAAPSAVPTSRAELTRLVRLSGIAEATTADEMPSGGAIRFVRLAPLAAERSLIEIFLPLLTKGTVEVYPGIPLTPAGLAKFITARSVTGLVLDSATCRRIADYRPAAFGSATLLFVAGDPLSASHADRIQEACPQLRISSLEAVDGWTASAGVPFEPAGICDLLSTHPEVREARVVQLSNGRLLAAVVTAGDPSLPDALRQYLAERVPAEAVPTLWAPVQNLPIGDTGELDTAQLTQLAVTSDPGRDPVRRTATAPLLAAASQPSEQLEAAIRQAWLEVLAGAEFGNDEDFFQAGGTSLSLLQLRARLRSRLPDSQVTIQELYQYPTVSSLAARLCSIAPGQVRA